MAARERNEPPADSRRPASRRGKASGPASAWKAAVPGSLRQRFPAELATLQDRVVEGPNHDGWFGLRCPLHEDKRASLRVNLSGTPAWECKAACGRGIFAPSSCACTTLPPW